MTKFLRVFLTCAMVVVFVASCAKSENDEYYSPGENPEYQENPDHPEVPGEDDHSDDHGADDKPSDGKCQRASTSQLATVNLGNEKAADFYDACLAETEGSPWCKQVLRPNPASISTFRCTYGTRQPHQLINPQESTWKYAFTGVQLVEDLEALGIKACQIYNWWRPEPYNANVGGAKGRHPYGTSIDVRFCSKSDMEKAFLKLCQWRKQGKLRAVGYYGSESLHLGIGDNLGNTWGKSCPR